MVYLIAAFFAVSVGLLTLLLGQLVPARPAVVSRRLAELERISASPFAPAQRRERQSRLKQLEAVLEQVGEWTEKRRPDFGTTRLLLIQAGYRGPSAVAVYRGVRLALPLAAAGIALLFGMLTGTSAATFALAAAAVGWIAPAFHVGARVRKRQKELRLALPDALDSLVVCVEAGLGLNQAMLRVAEEIRHISTLMSEELVLTNLEIRAGTPRDDALRNLAERTGLDDLRSLVTMLIQTDRFGTSIAQALRVQADTLREKRRQRAEEAAAKTSIKMLFPLIFFIFPAMFVITLGPAVIQLISGWANRPIP